MKPDRGGMFVLAHVPVLSVPWRLPYFLKAAPRNRSLAFVEYTSTPWHKQAYGFTDERKTLLDKPAVPPWRCLFFGGWA